MSMTPPKIITKYTRSPGPDHDFDWQAFYEDDLGETAMGAGATEADAIADLIALYPRGGDWE
jgi:hypothetical protein